MIISIIWGYSALSAFVCLMKMYIVRKDSDEVKLYFATFWIFIGILIMGWGVMR